MSTILFIILLFCEMFMIEISKCFWIYSTRRMVAVTSQSVPGDGHQLFYMKWKSADVGVLALSWEYRKDKNPLRRFLGLLYTLLLWSIISLNSVLTMKRVLTHHTLYLTGIFLNFLRDVEVCSVKVKISKVVSKYVCFSLYI